VNVARCVLVATVFLAALGAGGLAAAPDAVTIAPLPAPSGNEKKDRADAVARTKKEIEDVAKAHGGWDAWYDSLKGFREDLPRRMTGKWPWPAKSNFAFYGQSCQLLLMGGWDKQPAGADPLASIVSLDRQLKARGIDLIFMPIPDKISIYPDYLSDKAPADRMVFVQSLQLLHRLCEADVEVVDLFPIYHKFRDEHPGRPLHYVRDGHWRNIGAQIAGREIAARLRRYGFVGKALAAGNPYQAVKGRRTDGMKADDLLRVLPKSGGLYKDADDSPVVLTGDSFSMYGMGANSANLSAQVALHIAMPLTYVCREGLAVDMPVELARRGEAFLKGRRVIVWTVRGRCLSEGGWCTVDLSGKRKSPQPLVTDATATCVVADVSAPPRRDAPYVHYVIQVQVKDLADGRKRPIGDGQGVLHILAMRDRKLLPAAAVKKGDTLAVKLTTWSALEGKYGKINTAEISDVELAAGLAHYWAELPGQGPAPTVEAVK